MKKIKAILTILSILILPTGAFADMKSEVNPYGKFLAGDGVEVEMAEFAEKNSDGLYDVLLKMTGANAYKEGIDGKTVKCQAVHGGTGVDYKCGGTTRMILRNPYGDWWSIAQVFLDDKAIDVSVDKDKSKEVLPLHLLTASKSK